MASKMLIFEVRLPLKEPLVATFSETRALTFKKSGVVQDINSPKSTKENEFLWLHSSVFF